MVPRLVRMCHGELLTKQKRKVVSSCYGHKESITVLVLSKFLFLVY